MKKKIIAIIVIVLLAAIAIVCNINFKDKDKTKESGKITDAMKFKKEYEKLNGQINENNQKKYPTLKIQQDNVIKYADTQEILDVLKSKTGIVYFGFPECPWCRNAIPILLNAAASTGVEQVYYLDVKNVRDSYELTNTNKPVLKDAGDKNYQELLKALDSVLDDYILETEDGKEVKVGEKRVYVPLVVFIKNGKIIDYHTDTVDSQKDPYVPLTDEQTEELYNIYVEGILKMQDSTCDDRC